jgi:hypothetical protein
MWDLVATFLASTAGGGVLGGVLGIVKGVVDNKRELALEKIRLSRDRLDYEEADKERAHALAVMSTTAQTETSLASTEAEAAADIAQMKALKAAQVEFKGLKTSRRMDSFRASVRPVVAYWTTFVFSSLLFWVFAVYRDAITPAEGAALLVTLVSTLTFLVTSQNAFYYVSRRPSH